MNLFQLVNAVKSGNPQQFLLNMLGGNSNPLISNVMNMINNNDQKGLEQFARNLAKERGIDVDKALTEIQKNFK